MDHEHAPVPSSARNRRGRVAAPARPASAAAEEAPSHAFADARQPQVAVNPSGVIHLVYGRGNAIFSTASTDFGKTFSAPVQVAQVGTLALGMRRGPRVVATENAVVVTAIAGTKGKGSDENLLAWRSTDGGKTWRGPVQINGVAASAREGLHHTAAALDGSLYCVWLDLRHDKMEVYGAASKDGGASWQGERLVYRSPDGAVCTCCQPQCAYDHAGTLHVMWRNDVGGNRDMYLISSPDNGKSFGKAVKLGKGTWPLDRCPMDGGGLAPTGDGKLVTVWRRDKELFRCVPGQPEKLLGRGEQAWAAAGPDGTYLVWLAERPGAVLALVPGAGRPIQLAKKGRDPVVASSASGAGTAVAAWEDADAQGVRLTVLRPARTP